MRVCGPGGGGGCAQARGYHSRPIEGVGARPGGLIAPSRKIKLYFVATIADTVGVDRMIHIEAGG